jgi:hypothetical protein
VRRCRKIEGAGVADVEAVELLAFLQEVLSVGYDVAYGVLDVSGSCGDFDARQSFDPANHSQGSEKIKVPKNRHVSRPFCIGFGGGCLLRFHYA